MDHQVGASTKHENLHEHAEELGKTDQRRVAIAGVELQPKGMFVPRGPACQEPGQHAHGVEDVGVADGRIRLLDNSDGDLYLPP